MKIKISCFMIAFCCYSWLAGMQSGGVAEDPALFEIGGIRVTMQDAARFASNVERSAQDAVRDAEWRFDRRFSVIDDKVAGLEADRKAGAVDELGYQARKEALARERARVDADYNAARQNGQLFFNNASELFKAGVNHWLEKDKAQMLLDRAVAEASAAAGVKQHIANKGAKERLKMLLEKDNLMRIGVFLSLTTAGVVGSYYVLSYLYRYFEANMGMPTLIRDSSRSGWKDALFGGWLKKKHKEDAFDDVILAPDVNMTVLGLAKATALTHEKGLQYRHLLLYGPPGTGKTLIAKTMARSSGMDYAIISGADFSQFKPGTDVQKLHEVFDWADSGSRGLILFIDEADALLRDRKKLDERGLNLIEAFLSRTNASSDKFMIILATNYPETLDAAVLSRINKKVSIPLPGKDERFRLLKLYTNKYLLDRKMEQEKEHEQQTIEQSDAPQEDKQSEVKQGEQQRILNVSSEINETYLMNVAERTEGFSGRDIDQLLGEIRIEGFMTDDDTVTKQLFDRVVESKKAQQQQEVVWANKNCDTKEAPNSVPLLYR